ncbi:hypothetical protein ONZ45_g9797 [Pleurotus djamor]|nr:hypothetical protein ONZ45_g9797 [Pleurotus djamor]
MRSFLGIIFALVFLRLVDGHGFAPGQITDFVTFGDSYTDIVTRGDGPDATAWPVFVERFTATKLHPFAKSGATCTVNFTRPSQSVFEYQLPEYFKWKSGLDNTQAYLDPLYTVYTLWIGTGDLGVLLSGQGQGSIVDVVNCSVNWVKTLYDSGARNFIFQNAHDPAAADPDLAKILDCAHIGLFDSYGLFWDMYHQPKLYLNGTVAPNVLDIINGCITNSNGQNVCSNVKGAARDSYLWYNALHPSEQADRIVAREIGAVIAGNGSQWIHWLS